MTGFGALTKLDLDHLDLIKAGTGAKGFRIKLPIRGTTAKIASGNLPDRIAATSKMIFG